MSSIATAPTAAEPFEGSQVEPLIGGMTCASCAARMEKKLNRMDGVTATVNHATEKARISYPAEAEVADLNPGHDQGQPGVGLRLQRGRTSAGRGRTAQLRCRPGRRRPSRPSSW